MADITVRKRSLPQFRPGQFRSYTSGGTLINSIDGVGDLSGIQRTVSEGHQVSLLGSTDRDVGGDFDTYKSEVVYLSHPDVEISSSPIGSYKTYKGPLFMSGTRALKASEITPLYTSINSLNAKGATAIARCSPVSSQSELLTSAAETLKDGLPALAGVTTWKNRANVSKGAGSEYLNAQFGWLPLVSDVRDAVSAFRDTAKILNQMKRDSGRNVRRRYEFPIERTSEVLIDRYDSTAAAALVGTAPLGSDFFASNAGSQYHIRETTRSVWFSGAFTYHMPSSDTQMGKLVSAYQMADHLYGVGLTPELLWNLTPWSWATDWFANTGDILANVSDMALYGQILRYGYVMEKTTILDRRGVMATLKSKPTVTYKSIVKTTIKRRIRANPFGFGVSFDSLSGYQLGILAALGMSKS